MEVCKFMYGVQKVDKTKFCCHNSRIRGHLLKLMNNIFRTDNIRWHFSHCVTNLGNSLPQDVVVMVASIYGFQAGFDHFVELRSTNVL